MCEHRLRICIEHSDTFFEEGRLIKIVACAAHLNRGARERAKTLL